MRLLRALWKGRWVILLGALAGLALGAGYAAWKAETRYEVSLQLIKRFSPPTLQAGLNGEPYKPRQFTSSTLASAAGSFNVLDRVSRKSSPPVSVSVLKQSISVAEDKRTDFVTLTLSGYHSPKATVDLARLWSEEVINFTREMQSQESREIRKVIQSQLDSNEADLQRLDANIVEIADGAISTDMQIDAFVRSRADIESRYAAAKTELESLNSQLEGLRLELQRHTPAAEELRQARAELEQFRARYTDHNPLVIERMEKVASLEAEQKSQEGGTVGGGPSNLASTYIGNHLYLAMVQLSDRHNAIEHQFRDLEKQRDLFLKSPEKTAELMELLQKKQMLRTAQSLLLSRLQEVRIYEDNAPAFFGAFSPADLENVVEKTKLLKLMVYSAAGTMGGAFSAFALVLALAVADRKLRTSGEAAKAVGVPLFAAIPIRMMPEKSPTIATKIWTRWIGAYGSQCRIPQAVWCPAPHESESVFWRTMIAQARALLPGLLVVDCGATPSPEIARLPRSGAEGEGFVGARFPMHDASLAQARELERFIGKWMERGVEVWLRFDGAMHEPAATIMHAARSPLVLVALHGEPASFFREQAGLLRHGDAWPCGVVALNDIPIFASSKR